jgi:hypothetical protein
VATIHTERVWELALEKWAEIQARFPDLAPAATVQKAMLRLLIDARATLEGSATALPDVAPAAILAKWQRGLPALRSETIFIPDSLKDLLPALCDVLAAGGAGDSASHIRDALAGHEIDAGSLLRVSLARNRKAIRTSSLHHGFSPDLVWLIGELASSPLANYCQHYLLAPPGVHDALPTWNRGYCPCCGSWPALIEVIAGQSYVLRCSYCAGTWELAARRCVYCGNGDERFVVAISETDSTGPRLELCGACGGYTKLVDAASATPFPLIAIEDLATMELDEQAMTRGYRRPDLFDLDTIDPPVSGCG